MALNTFKCNHLMPLPFKGLSIFRYALFSIHDVLMSRPNHSSDAATLLYDVAMFDL